MSKVWREEGKEGGEEGGIEMRKKGGRDEEEREERPLVQ